MKKHVFGRKFKRDTNERNALFKGLMSSLVLNEKLETTESKAKAIRGEVDKLVTKAKKDVVLARRLLSPKLSPEALEKMITNIAPRFDKRQGGYTKMVRLGKRFGDDSTIVLVEWTEQRQVAEVSEETKEVKKETKPKRKPVVAKKPVKKTVKNKRAVKSSKGRSASGGKNA